MKTKFWIKWHWWFTSDEWKITNTTMSATEGAFWEEEHEKYLRARKKSKGMITQALTTTELEVPEIPKGTE